MSRQKLLRTELAILEKNFPRNNDGCFQIVIASPEELVCRFIDAERNNRFTLQCNLSVSKLGANQSVQSVLGVYLGDDDV